MMKETLKTLCSSNGWCYGVVWGFDHRNSLLLTLKDCYYEEQMGALIDSMLLQAHVVGGGIIGQTAFAKNHRWMDSDAQHQRQNCDSLENFQEGSEFFCQFSMGIKTIAVISVEPWGVMELGSTHKNPEIKGFVDQVQLLFREMDGSSEIEAMGNEPHSHSHFFNSSMQLDSSLSSNIFHSESLMGADHSLVLPSQPFPSTSNNHSRNLIYAESCSIENPIPTSSNQLDQLLLESANFFDCSASHQDLSSFSDCSLLTSSWPLLPSGLEDNTTFSEPRDQESRRGSILSSTSLQAQHFSRDVANAQNIGSSMSPTDSKAQTLSGLLTVEEFFGQSNSAKLMENDLSQLISPHTGNAPHSTGLIMGSSLSGSNTPPLPTNSLQSSVTYALRSSDDARCSVGVEPVRKKPRFWSENTIQESDCVSERNVGSKMSNSNSLFSKLGLDQLLDGVATTSSPSFGRSRFEDESLSAAKRRRTGDFSWSQSQVKFDGPSFDGKMKPCYPEAKNVEVNSEGSKKEAHSCIVDSYSMNGAKTSSSRRQEEQVKTKKKKAKAGTKPRPKDRQMIQDRLAELRELIPNGEKMSIDRLLERTIRHLNFMQSLTRHAENLKQITKPKSTEVWKNQSINGCDGGVTWAYEVGNDAMVCPLIVEDLSTPGQMLIEILCEEHGFFLEIVEIIRGFGLTILKGEMEVRETKKIWAHFMVEAEGTRCVTRHEIFSTLIQLLQMSGESAGNTSDSYGNVNNNFQPSVSSFPLNFADALQCGSL